MLTSFVRAVLPAHFLFQKYTIFFSFLQFALDALCLHTMLESWVFGGI